MLIETSILVARPVDHVWALIAEDFTGIANWFDGVVTATPITDAPTLEGAPMAGRVCTFSADPNGFAARERFTHFDAAAYTYSFDFEPQNAPAALPIKVNHVTVRLVEVDADHTEVLWTAEPELKLLAKAISPVVKAGIAKGFRGLLQDFKAAAEAPEATRRAS